MEQQWNKFLTHKMGLILKFYDTKHHQTIYPVTHSKKLSQIGKIAIKVLKIYNHICKKKKGTIIFYFLC